MGDRQMFPRHTNRILSGFIIQVKKKPSTLKFRLGIFMLLIHAIYWIAIFLLEVADVASESLIRFHQDC